MNRYYVFMAILLFPIIALSETIFLKDNTKINTNVYWEENTDEIGYFLNGKAKYIKTDLIDWNKTKERHALTDDKEKHIFNKSIVDENSIFNDINVYLKSIYIINKYGAPETLSAIDAKQWVVYFPKGDFTIITNEKKNRIIRLINGRGLP